MPPFFNFCLYFLTFFFFCFDLESTSSLTLYLLPDQQRPLRQLASPHWEDGQPRMPLRLPHQGWPPHRCRHTHPRRARRTSRQELDKSIFIKEEGEGEDQAYGGIFLIHFFSSLLKDALISSSVMFHLLSRCYSPPRQINLPARYVYRRLESG